jgi:hypothetical protein
VVGAAPLAGGRAASWWRAAGFDGLTSLGDDVLEAFALRLPDIGMPSEDDLLSPNELVANLLVGGRARADILPQRGSQLAPVATLLTGDSADEGPVASGNEGERGLPDLMMGPLALGPAALPGPAENVVAQIAPPVRDEAPPAAGGAWQRLLLALSAPLFAVSGLALLQGRSARPRGGPGVARGEVGLSRRGRLG